MKFRLKNLKSLLLTAALSASALLLGGWTGPGYNVASTADDKPVAVQTEQVQDAATDVAAQAQDAVAQKAAEINAVRVAAKAAYAKAWGEWHRLSDAYYEAMEDPNSTNAQDLLVSAIVSFNVMDTEYRVWQALEPDYPVYILRYGSGVIPATACVRTTTTLPSGTVIDVSALAGVHDTDSALNAVQDALDQLTHSGQAIAA